MTILSSLRVNFFMMLSLLILNKVACVLFVCVRVLYRRARGMLSQQVARAVDSLGTAIMRPLVDW